jgi:hypothetical protein
MSVFDLLAAFDYELLLLGLWAVVLAFWVSKWFQ